MAYSSYPRPPLSRPLVPPPRYRLHLSHLPEKVLVHIISLALTPPNPVSILSLLLTCRDMKRLAMPVVFHTIDTELYTARAIQTLLLLLDTDFDRRCQEYFAQSQPVVPLIHLRQPTNYFYPITPSNFFPSLAAGPQFRTHIRSIRIKSSWNTSQEIRPTWGVRGIPFAVLPVVLDILRRRLPALAEISVDLPKTLRTMPHQQATADVLGQGIVDRIAGFGNLETLSLDAWALDGGNIGMVIAGCSSLAILNLTRSHITVSTFGRDIGDPTFGLRLRRVTIADLILQPMAVPKLLKTCLNLVSLHLLGYSYDPNLQTDPAELIESYNPIHRRFGNGPAIAPIRTLVIRPSYRAVCGEAAFQHFTCLLYALSGTLVNLHFFVQGSAGPFFVSLLSSPAAGRLERVWYGYMYARDEVGDGVRLSRADDRRLRPGLLRGDGVRGSWEPMDWLPIGMDGLVPPLSPQELNLAHRSGGLTSEGVVLNRIGVDEGIVRALVDPGFRPPWPPTLQAFDFAHQALQPFEPLRNLLTIPRQNCLRSLYIFETEYVSSFTRQLQLLQRRRPPFLPGDVNGRGGATAWDRILVGNHGFNI